MTISGLPIYNQSGCRTCEYRGTARYGRAISRASKRGAAKLPARARKMVEIRAFQMPYRLVRQGTASPANRNWHGSCDRASARNMDKHIPLRKEGGICYYNLGNYLSARGFRSTSAHGDAGRIACHVDRVHGVMCRITDHAVLRYQQRVEPLDDAAVRAVIRTASEEIDIAADFGASVVVMGNGARLVLDGDAVVTVLGARHRKHRTQVRRAPRFEWVG